MSIFVVEAIPNRVPAWIGNPAEIGDPLTRIVAGTYDPQEDVLRLKVEQEAVLRLRRQQDREEVGVKKYNAINEQIIAGKFAAALTETEAALRATHLLQGQH